MASSVLVWDSGDLSDLSYRSFPPWASVFPTVNRISPPGLTAVMRVEEKPLRGRKLVVHTGGRERRSWG